MGRERCTASDYAQHSAGADRFAFYNQLHVLLMEELNKALNKIFAPVSDATELPDDAGLPHTHQSPCTCTHIVLTRAQIHTKRTQAQT